MTLPHLDLDRIDGLAKAAGYEVTRDGRVFSTTGWRGIPRREIVQVPDDGGYSSVRLTIEGRRIHLAVHRLVAAFYLPPRPTPDHEIRHLDGSRTNAHADNLKWGTVAENAADRKAHGRTRSAENGRRSAHKVSGEKSGTAKLRDADARTIQERFDRGERLTDIALDYPFVSETTIGYAARRRTFKTVLPALQRKTS